MAAPCAGSVSPQGLSPCLSIGWIGLEQVLSVDKSEEKQTRNITPSPLAGEGAQAAAGGSASKMFLLPLGEKALKQPQA